MNAPHGRPKEGSLPLGGTAQSAKAASCTAPHGRPKERSLPLGGAAQSAKAASSTAPHGRPNEEPLSAAARELVLVTGISGSGKSVALHALEDAGFYCVDNLPPELLPEFLRLEQARADLAVRRIAIAVDVRSAASLPHLLPLLAQLRTAGVQVRSLFLDASTDALMRRFSETRRRHPLSRDGAAAPGAPLSRPPAHRALSEAIELERELLAELRELSTVVDTSQLRPVQLREWVRQLVQASGSGLVLVFESFAYKRGVPLDADMVFDVRVLPNPHYVPALKALDGRDAAVAGFLERQAEVGEMLAQIEAFLARWLPAFARDQRAYLTVAIGCTGGQHRSVYFAEQLARRLCAHGSTLVRHRELDAVHGDPVA